jgi:hypothetical protein
MPLVNPTPLGDTGIDFTVLTQSEYDALVEPDEDVIYLIVEDGGQNP